MNRKSGDALKLKSTKGDIRTLSMQGKRQQST